jgi:hypothetical protein
MVPYILLIFVPLLFSFVTFYRRGEKHIAIVGGSRKVLQNSCVLPVFFIILILMLSLRDETIGRDLGRYKYYFNRTAVLELEHLDRVNLDALYVLLMWLVSRFTDDFQIFLVVVAVITVLPVAKLYCEDREHSFLKIILFVNMSNFVLLFSGLRQSIAMAVGIIAYQYVREKKPLSFLLAAIIAFGFHHSAFMIFSFYPLYYAKFKKKHLWVIIPAIVLAFAFNKTIFSIAVNVLRLISNEKYSVAMSSTGAYTMLLLFAAFAVFSYMIPNEKLMDQETLGLRNILLAAVVLQGFAPIHNLAMRLNYYFIIFIPILIPKILKYAKKFSYDVVLFMKVCIIVVLGGYYLLIAYFSCKSGVSALDTYPYVPFWK